MIPPHHTDQTTSPPERAPSQSSNRPSSSSWSSASQSTAQATRRGPAPISTSINSSSGRPSSSSHSPRNPWSPSHPNPWTTSTRSNVPRSTSISTSTSPFSPPTSHQQPPGLPSTRTRTATSTSNSGSGASQISGLTAPSGASGRALSRGSPSVSQGSLLAGSATDLTQTGGVSSIVIAQVTVLLSSLKESDKTKWQSQVDQLQRVCRSSSIVSQPKVSL